MYYGNRVATDKATRGLPRYNTIYLSPRELTVVRYKVASLSHLVQNTKNQPVDNIYSSL